MQIHSRKVVSSLIPLMELATNESLYLILETIRAIIALDKELLNPESMRDFVVPIHLIWVNNSAGGLKGFI